MALPDFKKTEQDKNVIPDWAKFMKDGEFISYQTTYKSKVNFHLFDEFSFSDGDMTIKYYLYNPIKHGADVNGKYPVTMWFHGASNSLMGEGCIMCCGAEQYATPKYQQEMGGAFVVVPLANETRLENGQILGTWDWEYTSIIKKIYDKIVEDYRDNISRKFIMGASSGGRFVWQLLSENQDFFDGAIVISSPVFPPADVFERISKSKTQIMIAHGRHDEMATFEDCIEPYMDKLSNAENCLCFFPEWVYNGDGGISSVFYGFEMGQHCMINWIQNNLVFDDGTPADQMLPYGVTGWIKSVCDK